MWSRVVSCVLLIASVTLAVPQWFTSTAYGTRWCTEGCQMILEPVCGSDGISYHNLCLLSVATCRDPRIFAVANGYCNNNNNNNISGVRPQTSANGVPGRNPGCSDVCPTDYNPVCGSDGNTYSNLCSLEATSCNTPGGITVASQGQCVKTCSEACTQIYSPVCGSNGATYPNICSLNVAACKNPSISKASDGVCSSGQGARVGRR